MEQRLGAFSPEQARLLWQDYLQRMRSSSAQRTSFEEVSPHRVFVKNTTGETIPSFGCMEITGVEIVGERTCLTVEKPTTEVGEYLLNSHFAIEPGANGWAFRYGVVLMLGDEPEDYGFAGVQYKPIVDSWELEEGPGPFNVWGRHDVNDRALIGRITEWPDVNIVLDEVAEAATNPLDGDQPTYTATILRRTESGGLEDSGKKLEVVNRYEHIDLAQYTLSVARRINREWRLISADCSALSDWPL